MLCLHVKCDATVRVFVCLRVDVLRCAQFNTRSYTMQILEASFATLDRDHSGHIDVQVYAYVYKQRLWICETCLCAMKSTHRQSNFCARVCTRALAHLYMLSLLYASVAFASRE